jgi:hypothetical protein
MRYHEAGDDPCSLTLTIGGSDYRLQRLPGADAWRLRGPGGKGCYTVTVTQRGVVCDCPDYIHRAAKASERCKHGRALVALGLIDPEAAVTPATPGDESYTGYPSSEACASA